MSHYNVRRIKLIYKGLEVTIFTTYIVKFKWDILGLNKRRLESKGAPLLNWIKNEVLGEIEHDRPSVFLHG